MSLASGETLMRKLALLALVVVAAGAQAQVVYDNTTQAAAFGFSSTDLSSTFGDSLTLASTGTLDSLSFSIFNSGSSAGALLTATVRISLYNDTVPYLGTGSLAAADPLLGSIDFNVNFGTGLNAGFFSVVSSGPGLSSFGINLTTNVVMTQKIVAMTGAATRLGVAATNIAPTVGNSPGSYMYINSATVGAEGYYNIGTNAMANPYYNLGVVPEPASMLALGAGLAALAAKRRKK